MPSRLARDPTRADPLAGLGLVAAPPVPVSAQAIHQGLFADRDSATRKVLAFLGGLGAHGPSATSCSPSTPTGCCWRVPAGLARRRRHRRHRSRRQFRLRSLSDHPHHHGGRPVGVAVGPPEACPPRRGRTGSSGRRLGQGRQETVLRARAGREPAHRAAPARGVSRTLIAETCLRTPTKSAAQSSDDPSHARTTATMNS